MNDLRTQLPECPLAYEVPFIDVYHTALVIPINAADIDWQEKMLPWTLASLINNTDIVIEGVHLYIVRVDGDPEDRIKNALKNFDLPEGSIIDSKEAARALVDGRQDNRNYHQVCGTNINYWAFRDESNTHKLIFSERQKITFPYPPISEVSPLPTMSDMTHCTAEQFRHAIKRIMGAQLAMKI